MAIFIALLRGINIGGHHKIKMDALLKLCESLGFQSVQTYLQSGNVIFRSRDDNAARVSKKIQDAIERKAGFRIDVMLRTITELREAIARNPFANRRGIEPNKFGLTFLEQAPSREQRENLLKLNITPEELHLEGRELYIYFTNGMARPSFSPPVIERTLKTPGTTRNWNTVSKLLEIAEGMARGKDESRQKAATGDSDSKQKRARKGIDRD